jgi:hypothetical protein
MSVMVALAKKMLIPIRLIRFLEVFLSNSPYTQPPVTSEELQLEELYNQDLWLRIEAHGRAPGPCPA